MEQPAPYTNLTGFAATYSNSQNLFYVGQDQRLYWLRWENGTWTPVDLLSQWGTVHITPPFPMPGNDTTRSGSSLVSNALEAYKSGYLFYIAASSGHVIGLSIPPVLAASIPKGTSLQEALNPDLTSRTGAPSAGAESPLASFGWESQKSQHVFYIGNDGNVWELYYVAGQIDSKRGGPLWQANNLSVLTGYTGDLRPKRGGPLVAFMFENQSTEHVVYIAQDQTIKELYHPGGKWVGNNLLEATQAPTPKADSPLAGYVAEYENTQHVIYVADNGDVQELYWNGAWRNGQPDLTQTTAAPPPASNSALFGWSAEYEQSEHVIYSDNSSILWELYHTSNGWGRTNLIQSAGSGAPSPVNSATPLAGYAFENQRTDHVLYLDQNKQLHELYRSGNAWYAGEKTG
jgi:hypothetical protein